MGNNIRGKVVVITGASSGLGEAAARLLSADLREIDGAVAKISVQGARYPEHLQKLVGR